MNLHYFVKQEDVLEFVFWHLSHSLLTKAQIKKGRVFALIMLAIFTILYSAIIKRDDLRIGLIVVMMIAGLSRYFLYSRYVLFVQTRKIKKALKSDLTLLGDQEIVFEDEQFRLLRREDDAMHSYATVQMVRNNKGNIYIYLNAVDAIILPDSAFASNEEREWVISLFKKQNKYYS